MDTTYGLFAEPARARLPRADLDHVLEHTGPLWSRLAGQRVLVTGGTGFFGHWLLETLLYADQAFSLGVRATVLSRTPAAFVRRSPHLARHPAVTLLAGDVCTFEFPQECHTLVIHAAAETSARVNEANPLGTLDTLFLGTRRVLEFMRRQGGGTLLLTSSGAVYGRQPPALERIPEEYVGGLDPQDVRSVYGEGKRLAELLCSLYASTHGLDVRVARCFAFVGPHLPLHEHFAIGNFMRDGLAGEPVVVRGDGTPYRSYLHAADLAIWLWTIGLGGHPGCVFNVGSGEAVSIRDLAAMVAEHFGVPFRVAEVPVEGRPASRYVPSVERAERELGLIARIPLAQAIARTASWHAEPRR